MPSPSLIIRRLVVEGELSCDITFDVGLNVIHAYSEDPRATNNAGKSTLVELIQHGLGKRQESKAKWYLNPIMDQLDKMYLEVELNNDIFTIERSLRNITASATIRHISYRLDISDIPGQKITVEEMSNWFLASLGIPLAAVSMANGKLDPLSFSLLMRAFVLNQRLSFAAILNKVMPEQRIADVIGFLTGIIPLERFTLERALSEKQIEVQKLATYYSSVERFLVENSDLSLENAINNLHLEKKELEDAKEEQLMVQMKINGNVLNQFRGKKAGRIESLQIQLLSLKENIARVKRDLVGVEQEQNRLEELLSSLRIDRQRVQRLRTSVFILNSVDFSTCPRCLQPITSEMRAKEEYGRCCLCSRPLATTSDSISKTVPRTEDIDMQIEEVESVLHDISREKEELQETLESQKDTEAEIGSILDAETRTFVAPAVDYLLELAHKVAEHEAELAKAKTLYDQVRAMNKIRSDLTQNRREHAHLEDELRQARKVNGERLEEFRRLFERILKEVDFPDLKECSIDSKKLVPLINGTLYLNLGAAYTSLVVVCYHLALLELARKEDTFFPLLLVVDSPNVHDMNERSENKLLHYFVRLATENDGNKPKNWQIILTTRKMVDGLDDFVTRRISRDENQMLLRKKH